MPVRQPRASQWGSEQSRLCDGVDFLKSSHHRESAMIRLLLKEIKRAAAEAPMYFAPLVDAVRGIAATTSSRQTEGLRFSS